MQEKNQACPHYGCCHDCCRPESAAGTSLPLIGDKAPAFKAETTHGEVNFPEDYKGKWVILFSHPADFTPVCTTEFMTFASMQKEFEALNTELIGLSIDSLFAHIAWVDSIKKIKFGELENIEIPFPIIVDLSMEVSKKYGMVQPKQSTTSAVRAVFVIDPEGVIRTILYYPQSTGRNMAEIKRIIQALQQTDAEGTPTPANWQPGDDVIIPPARTTEAARQVMASKDSSDKEVKDWFLVFKKPKA